MCETGIGKGKTYMVMFVIQDMDDVKDALEWVGKQHNLVSVGLVQQGKGIVYPRSKLKREAMVRCARVILKKKKEG